MFKVILVPVLAVIIFGGGILLGTSYKQPSGTTPASSQSEAVKNLEMLRSPSIESISAFGRVIDISGKNLTLSFGEDDKAPIFVKMKDDAEISIQQKEGTKISVEQTNFETIKIGDNVNIPLTILPNGELQGESVMIVQ